MNPAARIWAKPISHWEQKGGAERKPKTFKKPWGDYEDDSDAEFENNDDEGGTQPNNDGLRGSAHEQSQEAANGPTGQHGTRGHPYAAAERPQRRPMVTPYTFGDAINNAAQPRPRSYRLTDSSATDTALPPRAKCRFGDNKRGAARRLPPHDQGAPIEHAGSERDTFLAAIQAKDAQIAQLSQTLNNLQRTIETLMNTMAANGTISPQVVAGAIVEL